MPVAFLDRLERDLVEGHARFPMLLGERDRYQGLEAALALCLPGEREDEAFRRDHLAERPLLPKLLAVFRRAQAAAPGTAGPNIHLQVNGRVGARAPPVHGLAGVG